MVGRGKQLLLRDLIVLMGRDAFAAEMNLDRVLATRPIFADANQVVAHRVLAKVKDRFQFLAAAHLAMRDFVKSAVHSVHPSKRSIAGGGGTMQGIGNSGLGVRRLAGR